MQCIATITSQWGSRGYKGVPISRVENFTVDSAMDTDADQWSIDIGDPHAQLVDLLNRDSEVRVALTLRTPGNNLEALLQGYADTIGFTEDGILSLQGRDLSAVAVDDTAPPHTYPNMRPDQVILQQARERGFSKFNIASMASIQNLATDGSESVWDFWYRMVRTKKMFIWVGPVGQLNVGFLNYAAKPSYYFGTVAPDINNNPKSWVKVQTAEIVKNTSTRVGQVWAYGTNGKIAFGPIKAADQLITSWIKRPLHIITEDAAHTKQAKALQDAQEEIFEGIVGSIEVTLQVPNPGFIIRQNSVAYVNLPTMGFKGEYFVVGVRTMGSSNGSMMEIRLREKTYALSRRVPQDPTLQSGPAAQNYNPNALGAAIGIGPASKNWDDYFVISATKWHGDWDFALFLAGLYGICEVESSFQNIREGNFGGPEWTPPPAQSSGAPTLSTILQPPSWAPSFPPTTTQGQITSLQEWKKDFSNSAGNPLNPYKREAGVGPMQLTDLSAKQKADTYGGSAGEYTGARWNPAANIWEAGEVLAGKLQGLPPTEDNFWIGIERYNGSGSAAIAYMKKVKSAANNYLPTIKSALNTTGVIQAPGSTATQQQYGSSVPNQVRKIISFCEKQIGKPYVWAAEGPDGFDCSGLAIAAYAAGGDPGLPHNTVSLWNGKKGAGNLQFVPVDKLLPGDMVFFDVHGAADQAPQHVGVYYHDNQMIVAPHTGDYIKVESISSDSWTIMGGMRWKGIWPTAPTDASTYNPQPPISSLIPTPPWAPSFPP